MVDRGPGADFAAKVADLCTLYQEAPALAARGERVLSTDELIGVQARERAHPGLPKAKPRRDPRAGDCGPQAGTRRLRSWAGDA